MQLQIRTGCRNVNWSGCYSWRYVTRTGSRPWRSRRQWQRESRRRRATARLPRAATQVGLLRTVATPVFWRRACCADHGKAPAPSTPSSRLLQSGMTRCRRARLVGRQTARRRPAGHRCVILLLTRRRVPPWVPPGHRHRPGHAHTPGKHQQPITQARARRRRRPARRLLCRHRRRRCLGLQRGGKR